MPVVALESLPKWQIIEKLTTIIKDQDAHIKKLDAELALLNRKAAHGCAGFLCEDCDTDLPCPTER